MDFSQFPHFDEDAYFQNLWHSVTIARNVPYSLFTFGDSELKYYLVLDGSREDSAGKKLVKIRQGEIKISRPLIITPQNARPEYQDFFESSEGESLIQFLMTRSAAFSNVRLKNSVGAEKMVSDQVEEVVDRLNQQLDTEEEDRVAILVAPEKLAGVALIRYAAERILASAPENINEMRERGFLP